MPRPLAVCGAATCGGVWCRDLWRCVVPRPLAVCGHAAASAAQWSLSVDAGNSLDPAFTESGGRVMPERSLDV